MATAQAKALNELEPHRKVFVIGGDNRPQWSDEIFANNPRFTRSIIPGCHRLVSGGGVRPYIASKTATHWTWKRWDIQPGELYFAEQEVRWAQAYKGKVLVEPMTKVANSNKAWPFERWQSVVNRSGLGFVQCGPARNTLWLDGVTRVVTTFRQAAAILSVSRAFVGCEGAMSHVAAAVGVPAVVLFSEYIGIDITGYSTHSNIRMAGPACGARLPCAGCRASMERITVDEVVTNLRGVF